MANDFIALIFGGTDTLSPTLTTAGSRGAMRGLDGSLLLPAEYSQMSMLIAQHPTVKPLIEGFMRASVDGDYLAALTELRNIQAQVSGRSMQQILADPKTGTMEVYMNPIVAERTGHSLQELYGKAKEAAVGDARLNAWSSGDYTPNQRGIKEMFDQGAEDAAFYQAKLQTCEFYFKRILPRAQGHAACIAGGSDSMMSLASEDFSF